MNTTIQICLIRRRIPWTKVLERTRSHPEAHGKRWQPIWIISSRAAEPDSKYANNGPPFDIATISRGLFEKVPDKQQSGLCIPAPSPSPPSQFYHIMSRHGGAQFDITELLKNTQCKHLRNKYDLPHMMFFVSPTWSRLNLNAEKVPEVRKITLEMQIHLPPKYFNYFFFKSWWESPFTNILGNQTVQFIRWQVLVPGD